VGDAEYTLLRVRWRFAIAIAATGDTGSGQIEMKKKDFRTHSMTESEGLQ
jgi:hypothetical protein